MNILNMEKLLERNLFSEQGAKNDYINLTNLEYIFSIANEVQYGEVSNKDNNI